MRLIRATLLVLAPVGLVLGFSVPSDRQDQPPLAYHVKGRLFVDDQLAGKACIAFYPVDKATSQGRCAVAMTQQDGSFDLTTYAWSDGAPAGDYRVTLIWPDDTMPTDECECVDILQHDRLSGKYADPQTTSLLVTVLPQDNYVNLLAIGGRRLGIRNNSLPKTAFDESP